MAKQVQRSCGERGPGVLEKQQEDSRSWKGGRGGEGRKVRAEKESGQIVPGPVGRGEGVAFSLSELGAAAGLCAEEELI